MKRQNIIFGIWHPGSCGSYCSWQNCPYNLLPYKILPSSLYIYLFIYIYIYNIYIIHVQYNNLMYIYIYIPVYVHAVVLGLYESTAITLYCTMSTCTQGLSMCNLIGCPKCKFGIVYVHG